jgi:hypothetical protein
MQRFFRNRIKSLKSVSVLYWFLYCKLYDVLNFTFSKLDLDRQTILEKELTLYNYYNQKNVKESLFFFLFKKDFIVVDILSALFISKNYKNYNNINLFRAYFRVLQTNQGFYFSFYNLKKKDFFLTTLKSTFLSGLKYIWLGLRIWIISLTIGLSIVYYSMVIRCLPFNKTVFVWIVIGMFSYWLLSGFVFFVKKYQFGKFTSAIQRFWRRSYILFWLIEFSLFSVYLYLTFNANQESFYMFDQVQTFKTHLFSWRVFLFKLFPLTLLLIVGYLFLLTIRWNILSKHTLWLIALSVVLTYIVWVEFYQFFHVINFYGNFNWTYDVDERLWSLELEPRKTRTVNHYVMLLLILKFWHIVFIFGFWIFFVLRSLEIGRIRYPMLSANLQNFIILYLFAWVTMYPWVKFLLRRYLDVPYYWFYVNNRRLGYRVFFNDISLVYYGLLDYINYKVYNNLANMFNTSFFYWTFSNESNLCASYRKSSIKNIIIHTLSN